VRIAREVPGFAGYYRGEDGTLRVVMKAGASAEPLRGQLDSFTVVEGRYDFLELDAAHRAVMPVLGLAGVVYTDADEVANRVVVGVENEQTAAAVRQAAAMLGLDGGMVVTRIVEPIFPMQSLRDRIRPVAGGLQISFPGFLCTLGFNVRSPAAPNVHAFVTASHCTITPYINSSTPYWQPSGSIPNASDPNFIGTEVHDVPLFAEGPCPTGSRCRWSDAAGVRYAPGVNNAFGRIYRTTGMGSVAIDPANPMFTITGEQLFPTRGDEMHKVGRTTGWTRGMVSETCTMVPVNPDIWLLCQNFVSGQPGIADEGDSGSPVFKFDPSGQPQNVHLAGILWGRQGNNVFIFSSMAFIRLENQGLVPWITH
jgi:hypothetical protein